MSVCGPVVWESIIHDAIEFTLIFDAMDFNEELLSWDEISELYGNGVPTSDVIKKDIYGWCIEFYNLYKQKGDRNEPRLIQLQQFAKNKILERYGKLREYTVKALIDTVEIKVMATSEEEAISKVEKTIENKYKCKPKQLWTAGEEKK